MTAIDSARKALFHAATSYAAAINAETPNYDISCAQFLKAVSDEMIAGMSDSQRKIVGDFLTREANRYRYERTDGGAK